LAGYILIALSILSWGLWGFSGKIATKYNHPFIITALAGLFSPIASIVLYTYIKSSSIGANLTIKPLLWILLSAIMGITGSLFFYSALQRLQASLVVSLTALYPIITVLLSVLILKEGFPAFKWLGLSFILVGSILVIWEGK